jgi:hypothetical protein
LISHIFEAARRWVESRSEGGKGFRLIPMSITDNEGETKRCAIKGGSKTEAYYCTRVALTLVTPSLFPIVQFFVYISLSEHESPLHVIKHVYLVLVGLGVSGTQGPK